MKAHPSHKKEQGKLPKGYQLWGNYGDGLWRVSHINSWDVPPGHGSPEEAVDDFLSKNFEPPVKNFEPL